MTLSKREKIIFYLCIIVAITASLCVFVIEPKVKRWYNLGKEIESKELELSRDLKIVAQRESLDKKFKKIEHKLKVISSQKNQPSLWSAQLENLARQTKVQIVNIEPFSAKTYNFYEKSSIHMVIQCGLDNLTKFLYEMQNLPQMISVEKLQITSANRDASLLKVEMLISAVLPR